MEFWPGSSINNQKQKPGQLEPSESAALSKLRDDFKIRPEYATGAEKLNYEYMFSTGEVLSATENDEGLANIVIKRGDTIILNFNEEIPGCTFVTPTYLLSKANKTTAKAAGRWVMDYTNSLLFVGDMHSPKSILPLLHEIGHGRVAQSGKRNPSQLDSLRLLVDIPPRGSDRRKNLHEFAEETSDNERDAWAEALRLVREVKREDNVNLLEGFSDLAELRASINAALLSHRISMGKRLVGTENPPMGDILELAWERLAKKLWARDRDAEEWKFLETLFDKNTFSKNA